MRDVTPIKEAAAMAGISRQAIYKHIKAGRLESTLLQKKGSLKKRRYITNESLSEWLKEREHD